MKKILFTIVGILSYLEMFAQLGYRCEGKFIQMTPNLSGLYYVQARNSESKTYLENSATIECRQDNGKNKVYCM